jgi:aspartate/methionine/tyrosine aminotransferase
MISPHSASGWQPSSPSYAGWVRNAIAMARGRGGQAISLFESSIPEPRDLLRQAVLDTVEPEFSANYVSAFGDGNPVMRGMVAQNYGVDLPQVLCTAGATSGLSLIYRTFLSAGDHVLVETPGFDVFSTLAQVQGARVDTFQRRGERFAIDVAEVAARLRPNTRLVVLSDLHNPSGMLLDRATMTDLAALAQDRGFLLVVDEVYGDYADKDRRPLPACALSPNVISLSGLTKIYGLGVLRCGWIVGALPVMERLRAVNSRAEFAVSTLSHAVGTQVMARADQFDAHTRAEVARCRPRFAAWYDRMVAQGLLAGALPDEGCICFPAVPGVGDTHAFSQWLIARSSTIVAPGAFFGAPGHIRIGFCLGEAHVEAGLAALEDGLRSYPG